MIWKCPLCSKEFISNGEYNKETEDVGNGFEWETIHKEEFCNKTLN